MKKRVSTDEARFFKSAAPVSKNRRPGWFPLGSTFGASGLHLGQLLALRDSTGGPPFLVNSGSISSHPGSNFIKFGIFFCVCLLFGGVLYFFGLLDCCVVGLLGFWILELLGCFVAGLLCCWVVWLSLGCWVVDLLCCWVVVLLCC